MKFYLLLCLFSIVSFAEISTERVDTRSVSDLMYLPEAGTWFTNLSYGQSTTDSKLDFEDSLYYDSESESTSSSFEVGKVIKENILVSLSVPFLNSSKNKTTYGPASTSDGDSENTESDGMRDISLNLKWRLKDQKNQNMNMDFLLYLSPKTGDSESSSSTEDGNFYRGGTDFGTGLEIGKKMKNIQYSARASFDINGSREVKLLSDDSTSELTSYNTLTFSGYVQLIPDDKFFINAGLLYVRTGDFESRNDGSKTEYSIDPYIQYAIGGGYEFSDSFALRLIYSSANIEREVQTGSVTLDEEIESQTIKTLAQFQF